MTGPTFLLMYHAEGASPLERRVDEGRASTVRDTARRAAEAGFEEVVLATTTPEPFVDLDGIELIVDDGTAPFGRRLKELLTAHPPDEACYAGSGMPLMTADDWGGLRERIDHGETITNNLYSSDLIATPEIEALRSIPDDLEDNGLALHLRDAASIEVATLPRSARTMLDIDTPTELAVLRRCLEVAHFDLGPELVKCLAATTGAGEAPAGPDPIDQATGFLTQRETDVLVIGRVGSAVWQALESDTATRVRVVSEERGLRSRPDGQARSLLGFHLGAVGPEQLVEALGELGDAIFIDTRPLFAHLQWNPTRADRFASDAGEWESIAHPELQAFTRAAVESRVPFVLGGHALVSGGLLALIDAAWARWEAARVDD